MATTGHRTLKATFGKAGSFLNPIKSGAEGLRGMLKALMLDINDLRAHTHRYNGANAGVDSTSTPKSDAGGADATGGTAVSITAYTVE